MLVKAISQDRLATYLAQTGDLPRAVDLYIWDRDISMAILADIAVIEVALRNALHDVFTIYCGRADWYEQLELDERSRRGFANAHRPSRKPGLLTDAPPPIPDAWCRAACSAHG